MAADQAASTVAAAVIAGITDRALATVMRKLHAPAATVHEKLVRLELLVLKVRSAVEVSEKHAIESASLLGWRDRLKEAAAEAGEVLLHFQRRAREDAEAARSSSSDHNRQRSVVVGGGATAGALYFTRSSLSGMAQRVRAAAKRLFSTDEDVKKLDSSLEKMEQLSPDIKQFVMLLHLEVYQPKPLFAGFSLPNKDHHEPPPRLFGIPLLNKDHHELEVLREPCQQPTKRKTPPSSFQCSVESSHRVTLPADSEQRPKRAAEAVAVLEEDMQLASAEAEDRENEARVIGRVLRKKLWIMKIRCNNATNRDLEGLEWLAQWAAVLREAVERGDAVCKTLCPGPDVSREPGGAVQDDDELYSFARAVEGLALDVHCFKQLLSLCPRKVVLPSGAV